MHTVCCPCNDCGLNSQLLSVLFHACCLGLLDACLPMASTFTALTCGISQQGEMVPQPTPLIEKVRRLYMLVSCSS